MEGSGSPYTDRYVKVMSDWNYDESCMVTSLPVWDRKF